VDCETELSLLYKKYYNKFDGLYITFKITEFKIHFKTHSINYIYITKMLVLMNNINNNNVSYLIINVLYLHSSKYTQKNIF